MHDDVVSWLCRFFDAFGKAFMFCAVLFQKCNDILILNRMILIFFFNIVLTIDYIRVKAQNHRMFLNGQFFQMIQHKGGQILIMPVHDRSAGNIKHRFSKQYRADQYQCCGNDFFIFRDTGKDTVPAVLFDQSPFRVLKQCILVTVKYKFSEPIRIGIGMKRIRHETLLPVYEVSRPVFL